MSISSPAAAPVAHNAMQQTFCNSWNIQAHKDRFLQLVLYKCDNKLNKICLLVFAPVINKKQFKVLYLNMQKTFKTNKQFHIVQFVK